MPYKVAGGVGIKCVVSDVYRHQRIYLKATYHLRTFWTFVCRFVFSRPFAEIGCHRVFNLLHQRLIFVFEHEDSQVVWLLYTYAAMRDHAVRAGEDAWRRGVMHVYAVIVIESEYQPAERIAASAPLHNGIVGAEEHLTRHVLGFYNLAGAALTHEVVVTIEIGMVAYMMHNARLDDALRDYPLGVEIHSLYLAVEQRCLRLKRSYRHLHHETFVAVVGIEMQAGTLTTTYFLCNCG